MFPPQKNRNLTTDSICWYIQIRLIIPLESRKHAREANIVRRILDVIHYSAEIWRSSKSRFSSSPTKGCATSRRLSPIPCRKGGNLSPTPRSQDFLSISRQDRKARPAVRRGASIDTIEGHILLLRLILDFLYTAMPRFR